MSEKDKRTEKLKALYRVGKHLQVVYTYLVNLENLYEKKLTEEDLSVSVKKDRCRSIEKIQITKDRLSLVIDFFDELHYNVVNTFDYDPADELTTERDEKL